VSNWGSIVVQLKNVCFQFLFSVPFWIFFFFNWAQLKNRKFQLSINWTCSIDAQLGSNCHSALFNWGGIGAQLDLNWSSIGTIELQFFRSILPLCQRSQSERRTRCTAQRTRHTFTSRQHCTSMHARAYHETATAKSSQRARMPPKTRDKPRSIAHTHTFTHRSVTQRIGTCSTIEAHLPSKQHSVWRGSCCSPTRTCANTSKKKRRAQSAAAHRRTRIQANCSEKSCCYALEEQRRQNAVRRECDTHFDRLAQHNMSTRRSNMDAHAWNTHMHTDQYVKV